MALDPSNSSNLEQLALKGLKVRRTSFSSLDLPGEPRSTQFFACFM